MGWKKISIYALIIGIALGLIWGPLGFGDHYLDKTFGQNYFNWFGLPLLILLIISLTFYFLINEEKIKRFYYSLLFFIISFIAYLIAGPYWIIIYLIICSIFKGSFCSF